LTIITNKKAFHDYFIEEKYEAGIVLEGGKLKLFETIELILKSPMSLFKEVKFIY